MGNDNSKPSKSLPEDTKDIIIKCGLEEMVRQFFKDYAIVWHDPNVNSPENQQYKAQLQKFCDIKSFSEWEKAAEYILASSEACHVITSGTNGELLVQQICNSQNVAEIYIFCGNKEFHSEWASEYPKISCIETDIQNILNQIEQNLLKWYKQASSLKITLPAFAPIFNDNDKSEMNHLHHYLKVVPNFKNREQAKKDVISLSRMIYSDQTNLDFIQAFDQDYNEYNKAKILNWYTQESFLYKMANNCLRIATSDSIQYCRFILRDIEQAIKEHYQEKSKEFNGVLYRGAYLSQEEWTNLKSNLNKDIEMHGFLSVSKVKNVALHFTEHDSDKKAFITIIVPKGPHEEEQGFAEVHQFSDFPQEKEILFNVRSRFTVLETEDEYSEDLKCRHLVLLYGAQGFRKFIADQEPIQEVSISNLEGISCAYCQTTIHTRMLFLSLEDLAIHTYYCKTCLPDFIEKNPTPLLCIPARSSSFTTQIKGFFLRFPSKDKTPFYGYKCSQCQTKPENLSFKCTDCQIKWCEHCFETSSSACTQNSHAVIIETHPFTFWTEKMSENELQHIEFQKEVVTQSTLFQQATMYSESHQYEKAIEFYNIYIEQNKHKKSDTSLAISYSNLGDIYESKGEYKQALDYYNKCLEIEKEVYGEKHSSTAGSYNNIGVIYKGQGNYKKALEFYHKALNIKKSLYGENRIELADNLNNIGLLHHTLGEDEKALECYTKALEIKKSTNGENHISLANTYSGIATIYLDEGEIEKSLEYYDKALVIEKSVHGEKHPDVAISYNNIGLVYLDQKKHDKALEYYFKSINIEKTIYGENHHSLATSYNNIGSVYKEQGESEKALEYYSKSLKIEMSVFGESHPSIATTLNHIGGLYERMKDYNKALGYYLECLRIEKLFYGENHNNIFFSFRKIAVAYKSLKEFEKAVEYYLKCLKIEESAKDKGDKEEIAEICNNIAGLYKSLKRPKKAYEYYLKALEINRSLYGENHKEVAKSYDSIGRIHAMQKDFTKAIEYCSKSLEIRKLINGKDHISVATSYSSLGLIYWVQGKFEKSIEYYSLSLEISKPIYREDHAHIKTIQDQMIKIKNGEQYIF